MHSARSNVDYEVSMLHHLLVFLPSCGFTLVAADPLLVQASKRARPVINYHPISDRLKVHSLPMSSVSYHGLTHPTLS